MPRDAGVGDVDDFNRRDGMNSAIDLHHQATAADRQVIEPSTSWRQ